MLPVLVSVNAPGLAPGDDYVCGYKRHSRLPLLFPRGGKAAAGEQRKRVGGKSRCSLKCEAPPGQAGGASNYTLGGQPIAFRNITIKAQAGRPE